VQDNSNCLIYSLYTNLAYIKMYIGTLEIRKLLESEQKQLTISDHYLPIILLYCLISAEGLSNEEISKVSRTLFFKATLNAHFFVVVNY